ncbi:hypothetical protein [Leucobacter sp. Psy1]|uniref:hypothetical protein n=1 Tax=Leucobacter sp. Psy1 TaxID=2875729 RepID=UPI001CD4BBE5|nr:hypothetical protein [Leucobacter sp. Psy1]
MDEEFLALSGEEEEEVRLAVYEGRRVRRPELASLAVRYADFCGDRAGLQLYRSWWYVSSVVLGAAAIVTSPVGWVGAIVFTGLMGITPALGQGRVRRARIAARENRDLLDESDLA